MVSENAFIYVVKKSRRGLTYVDLRRRRLWSRDFTTHLYWKFTWWTL